MDRRDRHGGQAERPYMAANPSEAISSSQIACHYDMS